mgnify:CR=1 FL=1
MYLNGREGEGEGEGKKDEFLHKLTTDSQIFNAILILDLDKQNLKNNDIN